MGKTFLYKILGIGKVPERVRPVLEQEGIVLIDEGIRVTVTYRNFRAPRRYHSYKKKWFTGSLVLTQKRIIGFAYWKPILNIPLDDSRLNEISWSSSRDRALCATFEAGLFHDGWSGLISCCFFTDLWPRFLAAGGLAQRAGDRGEGA